MAQLNADLWYRHAVINRVQSLLLLGVMAAFLALLGGLIWGGVGVVLLLLVGALMVVFNPVAAPRWVLRLYGATPLRPDDAPALYAALEVLAQRAGLRRLPHLYYVPSAMVNAFAVGSRRDAAIGVSDGLLRHLDRREIIAVLAHEISHIRSNDIWVMSLADLFSRLTSLLSLFGQLLLLINLPLILFSDVTISWWAILLLIFAPTLSALAQLGLSRTREYDADLNAARLTGDPGALASALVKIERVQGAWLERVLLPGRRIPEPSLLRTHPPTEERVRRLLELRLPEAIPSPYADEGAPAYSRPIRIARVQRRPHWHWSGLWH